MKWSSENSNTYDSIRWRLGTAFKAQESISQSVSRPLGPEQWQIEASQLFATSLGRILYDAWVHETLHGHFHRNWGICGGINRFMLFQHERLDFRRRTQAAQLYAMVYENTDILYMIFG